MNYKIDSHNSITRLAIVWKELEVFEDKYVIMQMTQMQNKFSKYITIGGRELIKLKDAMRK